METVIRHKKPAFNFPLSRPIHDKNDFEKMLFQIDKVSKTCGADSVFEFSEKMTDYKVVYNFKDFCIMVSIHPTLYYMDVQTEIGITPIFSNKEEYSPWTVEDLVKIPKSTYEIYKRAKEKQEEIEQKIREALDY